MGSKSTASERAKKAAATKAAKKAAPKAGTVEALNDEQMQALFFQHLKTYEQKLALKKQSDANFKNACKVIKAEGTKLTDIKTAIRLNDEAGERAVKDDVASTLRVARWLGSGIQMELFGEVDRTPGEERAFEEGKRAGMKGAAREHDYAVGSRQAERWHDGYQKGQDILAQGFKKKAAEPEGEDEAKGGDGGKQESAVDTIHRTVEAGDAHIRKHSPAAKIGDKEPTFERQH